MSVRKIGGDAISAMVLLGGLLIAGNGCNDSANSPNTPSATVSSAKTAPKVLSADELRQQLDTVIEFSRARLLNPQVNNAWQIVHGVLAYGYDLQLNVDGRPTPGLDWILGGGKFQGWVFTTAERGLKSPLDPGSKVGSGHEDQWLGYLSQSHVPLDAVLVVNGDNYRVSDLLNQAKWECRDGAEATWTLMALGTYLSTDDHWQAKDGSTWTLDRLVASEAAQELNSSSCGGSHRLYGLTVARNRRLREGKPLDGGFATAERVIQQSINRARELQNPDGTFSTNYFLRASTAPDPVLRINTTGHTLEFLALAMPKNRLEEDWVVRATVALNKLLIATKDIEVECGGLYHAAHGLRIYRARRYGEVPEFRAVITDLVAD